MPREIHPGWRLAGRVPWSERLRRQRGPGLFGRHRLVALISAGGVSALAVGAVLTILLGRGGRPLEKVLARRGRLAVTLREVGELHAEQATDVYSRAMGEVTWLIEEGKEVKPGDLLVELDDTDIVRKIEEQERQLDPTRSEYERSVAEVDAAKGRRRLRVRQAELKLQMAEWKLTDLLIHPTEDEMRLASLEVEEARLKSERARKKYERATEVNERGMLSGSELKRARLEALDAKANLGLAELRFELRERGPGRLSVETARLEVARGKMVLEEERASGQANLVIAEKAVQIAGARLDKAESWLERLKRDLENCSIRAPVAGTVRLKEVWKGTGELTRIHLGEIARWGQAPCSIADSSRLQARMMVSELDALSVRPGMEAVVRPTALPGVELRGEVRRMSPQAFDKNEKLGELALKKAGRAGVNVVEVEIGVLETDPRVKLGFTATVEVVLAVFPSAVLVPTSALFYEGEEAYCFLGDGARRHVKVIGSNELECAVEGIEEGEEIVRDALRAAGRSDAGH